MHPVILLAILFSPMVFASQRHIFEVSVRTSFKNIFLHKMIAEREVLSLGRECSIQEFPQQVEDWGCDSDENGVLCKKRYTCLPDGGKAKRYAHIKGIENLLAREISATRNYEKLDEIGYSSRNGSYFLKTDYYPPGSKKGPKRSNFVASKEAVKKVEIANGPKEMQVKTGPQKSSKISDIPTEDISPDSPYYSNSDVINAEAYVNAETHVDYSHKEYSQAYGRKRNSKSFAPGEGRGLEFDLSLGWIKDNNGGSLRTTHLAWTPKYKLDRAFMIGFDIGVQVLESPITDESYFIAVDGLLSGHFFITDSTYLKVCGGIQRWNGELKGNHSLWGAGLGVELSETISRVFVQYMNVGNLTKNEEYRIGFGLSF